MAIFFPLSTNGFVRHARRALLESDWQPFDTLCYSLKVSFLLFDEIYIETEPLLKVGIVADDTTGKAHRKIRDSLRAYDDSDEDQLYEIQHLEQGVRVLFPVLSRWSQEFGLLMDPLNPVESVAKPDPAELPSFNVIRSRIPEVHFVDLWADFSTEFQEHSFPFGESIKHLYQYIDPNAQPIDFDALTRHKRAAGAAYRDALAADALKLPIHYLGPTQSRIGDSDVDVKALALHSILEVAAPNLDNVHLTRILEIRQTSACAALRALIEELADSIRQSRADRNIEKLKREIQQFWMGRLLSDLLAQQKEIGELKVDVLSGALSLIPVVSEFLAAKDLAQNVRKHLDDKGSWTRVFTELQRI